MTTVIHAENLSKQYLIRHDQQGQRFVYDGLGKTLASGGKAFCRRLCSGFPRPNVGTLLEPAPAVSFPTLERGNEKISRYN